MLDSVKMMTSKKPSWEWNSALGDGKTAQKVTNILRGKHFDSVNFNK